MRKLEYNRIKMSIMLVFLLFCTINLYGCFSYSIRAESIAIDESSIPDEATVSDFDITQIRLLVTRVDGSIDLVNVTENMVSSESMKKLQKSGLHNIYIRYDGKLTILTIRLVDKYSNVVVTFDSNGGSSVSTQSIEKNSKVLRPINPTKFGYIFSGWYVDKEFKEEFLFSSNIDKNITLYAKWEEAINTISYITNCSIEIPESKVKTGEKLFEIIPNREGYAFEGWYKDSELTIKYDYDTLVNESFSLYAKWEANKHRINFKCNGGTSISSVTVYHDEKLEDKYVTTKTGYSFAGWYLDSNLTIEYDFDSIVTENFTLYAKWTKAQIKVEFETNGGTLIDTKYVEYGKTIQEEFLTTRSNGEFIGWYLDSNLTIEFDINERLLQDIVLYAKWKMNDINILFETNGGTTVKPQVIKYGEKVAIPDAPKRIGYTFVGWYSSKDYTEEYDFDTLVYIDTVIYARWIIDSSSNNKYSVVIFYEDIILDSFKVEEGSTLKDLKPIELDHMIFVGWYSDRDFINEYNLKNKINSNISIYAKYIYAYEVKYLDINGDVILIQYVGEEMDATPPAAPEVKGYIFSGWDKDLTNVNDNIITKAQYTARKYEVKFIVDGKIVSTQKVSAGKKPTEPVEFSDCIETGYHFKKWDKEIDAIYQDTTYIAVLEKNTYTINFVDYYGNIYFQDQVLHGETIEKPNKNMNTFYTALNWYTDNEFSKKFDFYNPILKSMNIYGEFDFNSKVVYTVNNDEITITNIDLKNIKELTIPKNLNSKQVTVIEKFSNYDDITKIIITENLKKINLQSVYDFENLKEIIVLENNYYESLDGVLYTKENKKLLLYPRNKTEISFVIPDSVTEIAEYAFYNCNNLMKIDLNNVSKIGKEIIANSNIYSLIINKDGIVKDNKSFENCQHLIKIIVKKEFYDSYKTKWSDVSDMIYSTENVYNQFLYKVIDNEIEIVEYLGSDKYIEIPEKISGLNVSRIGEYAFNSNFDLRGITLPLTIVSIKDNAFYNLQLEYLILNSSIELTDEYIKYLNENNSKTNIYIKDAVYNEYENKFNRCYYLSQIVGDYSYIYKNNQWGILQYFGKDKIIKLPDMYENNLICFLDENFIINEEVVKVNINGKIRIDGKDINKGIMFFVDDELLEYYSQYDYAIYSKEMETYEYFDFMYGVLNDSVIIIKINSNLNKLSIPEYIAGKKVETIGRYALITNKKINLVNIGKNIKIIKNGGLKTKQEINLEIVFNSEFAPQTEGNICYESDLLYKSDYRLKGYTTSFPNHNVTILNAKINENDEYKYYLFDEKISIIEYLGSSKELIIPETIDDYPVVSIEPYAFSERSRITKVIIPSSVEVVGYLAFDNMKSLSEIIINSKKVVYIEDEIVRSPIVIRVDENLLYRYRNSEYWQKQEVFSKTADIINDGKYQYVIEDDCAIIIKVLKSSYSEIVENKIGNYKIKKLGAYSFYDTDIRKMQIYDAIEEIGNSALPLTLKELSLESSEPLKLGYQEGGFDVIVSSENFEVYEKDLTWNKYRILKTKSSVSENDDFEYIINSDGATITKYLGESKNVVIPDYIEYSDVVKIGKNAFSNMDIESVKFGKYVAAVDDYAFYNCENLSKFEFSENIIYIGEKAFDNTKWLSNRYSNLVVIGRVLYKLNESYIVEEEIDVSDDVVSISPYAFENTSIVSVNLPKTIETIGKGAFKGCNNLLKITIPKKVVRIEEETFMNCKNMKNIILNDNIIFIGKSAFENCKRINDIDLYGVQEIDDKAFLGCESLNQIVLPSSIQKLGQDIFLNCELLSDVTIKNGSNYKIVDGVLYNKSKTILLEDLLKSQKRNIEVLSTVELIKEKAFYGSYAKKVIISSKVSIENDVFGENDYLEAIVFTTNNVPTITETSFSKGSNIYFSNKIIDVIKDDYLYENYIVNEIFAFSQKEYNAKVGDTITLIPICPLEYENSDVTFVSSDEKVLSYKDGKITCKDIGNGYITAYLQLDETYIAIVNINVEK